MGEKLGALDEAKLSALLRRTLLDEPAQESAKPAEAKADEKPAEETSEEAPAKAEADEDTNDLSQESTDQVTEEETQAEQAEEPAQAEDDGLPKGVQKRIDKLTARNRESEAKAKELEAKVAELEAKLNQAPAVDETPIRPTPDNPYLHLQSQKDVEAAFAEAKRVKRWCEMNPDGGVVKGADGTEKEYTAEEVRSIRLNAADAIDDYLPKQLSYVQARAQIDPQAEATYTWWKDRSSKEYQTANQMLQVFPELRKFPDYKMVVGDYIRGAQVREAEYAKQKSATSAKPVVKKAPAQPTRPVAAPPTVTREERKAADADARFRKAPTSAALKDIIASQFI
ncbi:MAG: hypothetical protein ACO32S_04585 [Steroidobacteraceae bacterium]